MCGGLNSKRERGSVPDPTFRHASFRRERSASTANVVRVLNIWVHIQKKTACPRPHSPARDRPLSRLYVRIHNTSNHLISRKLPGRTFVAKDGFPFSFWVIVVPVSLRANPAHKTTVSKGGGALLHLLETIVKSPYISLLYFTVFIFRFSDGSR